MDSDDEYNSGMSSQEGDFEETLHDSDDDSLEEGLFPHDTCHLSASLADGLGLQTLRMTSQTWDFPKTKTS